METVKENKPALVLPEIKRRWKKKPLMEITKVIQYAKMGLSDSEICTLTGLPNITVQTQREKFLTEKPVIPTYKDTKAEVMNKIQEMIADGITEEKIADTGIRDLSGAFKVFHEAERLESGKATAIVSHTVLLQNVAAKLLCASPVEDIEQIEEADHASNG